MGNTKFSLVTTGYQGVSNRLYGSIAGALPQQEVDKCHDKLM